MRHLFQQIQFHALAHPARPAVMLADRVITFGMMQSGIDSVRQVLAESRLEPDNCVGVAVDNPARHLIISLALIANGHVVASLREDLLQAAIAAGVTNVITDAPLPITPGVKPIFADDKWFTNHDAPKRALPSAQPNRMARIVFTSGSTGRPKALAYTVGAQMARLETMFMTGMGRHRRIMCAYGISGPGFQQALQTLSSGQTICFAPPDDIVRIMSYFNVDELRGSVGQIRTIQREHDALDRPMRLEALHAGGAYLPVELLDDVRASFSCEVNTGYSSMEAGAIGFATGSLLALRRDRRNCYNIVCDLQIVSDTGKVLPEGTEGLIRVRSPRTCRPFTGALIEDVGAQEQWVYPSDRGRIDPDGLLIVTGRNDEVINIGGGKVDPEILENFVRGHPAIEEFAAVRMTADAGLDEAWAVAKVRHPLTLEELNKWLSDRIKGEMRGVRFARLEVVNDIPRTQSAKIARGALRKILTS